MGSDHDLFAINVGFFNAGCKKVANDGPCRDAGVPESTDLAVDIGFFDGRPAVALTWGERVFNSPRRPRGRSSVGLERRPVTPKVAGSSPVAPASLSITWAF